MKLPQIIGVAGTNGSGKDTLAAVRARLQHTKDVSLSNILRAELDKRGLPHDRQNMGAVGDEWRSKFGPGVMAVKTIEQYEAEKQAQGYTGLSMTSIRNPGEAAAIKAAGGIIIWVDADPQIRYERITSRGADRPTDQKTFEQFVAEEEVEMHPADPTNPAVMNMAAIRDAADIAIINEFASLEDYENYLIKEFELA